MNDAATEGEAAALAAAEAALVRVVGPLTAPLDPVPSEPDARVRAWSAGNGVFVLVHHGGTSARRSLPLDRRAVFRELEPERGRLWGPVVGVEAGAVTVVETVPDGGYPTPALLGARGTVRPDGSVTASGPPGSAAVITVRDAAGDDDRELGVLLFDTDGIGASIGPWTTAAGQYAHLPSLAGDIDVVAEWVPGDALIALTGSTLRIHADFPAGTLARVYADGAELTPSAAPGGLTFDVDVEDPNRPIRLELSAANVRAGAFTAVRVVGVPRRTTAQFRGPLRVRGSAWLETAVEMPLDWPAAPGVTIADVVAFHARPDDPPGATFEPAVPYGPTSTDGRALTLDLYRSTDPSERRPIVLFIHGGGWAGGDPWFHIRHAHALAARGYVTAVVRYRLYPEAMWPAALEDVACAVRWARAHGPEIGGDPNRVAVAGGSAGGHLSAFLALGANDVGAHAIHGDQRSDVQAAVLWYPATDLLAIEPGPDLRPVLDNYFGAPRAEALRAASPVTRVHSGCAPILTITGSADRLTTLDAIREFHRALDAHQVTNRLEVLDGRDHAFDLLGGDDWHRAFELAAAFLDEQLVGPHLMGQHDAPVTHPPTDPATGPPTDPGTGPPTDPATSPPTDPATSPPTDPAIDKETI